MGKNDYGSDSWGSGWARVFKGLPEPPSKALTARTANKFAPGRRVIFVPDHESFGRFILSAQVRKPTAEVAAAIAKLAGLYAPRRKDRGTVPDGTAMADRFEVREQAGTLTVKGNPRVKVEVYNSARSAAPNEFGGKRNKRHRMLGRAGAAFGDFKPEGGLEL